MYRRRMQNMIFDRSTAWPLGTLSRNQDIRDPRLGLAERVCRTRYPTRLLRYWFAFNALRDEAVATGRPLRVLEVGVGNGKMKAYANAASRIVGEDLFADWCGVTMAVEEDALRWLRYREVRRVDITEHAELDRAILALGGRAYFDAVLVLHVLEHLERPEETFRALCTAVRPGGLVVGGTPGTPAIVRRWWERRLRRNAAPFGHVSAFCTKRIGALAAAADLEPIWMTGAFLLRMSGSRLENNSSWIRANLMWGACFPGWPGELYWSMRKPGQHAAKSLLARRPEGVRRSSG